VTHVVPRRSRTHHGRDRGRRTATWPPHLGTRRSRLGVVVAGVSHFVQPTPFVQHLPEWVPAARSLIYVTGAIEIALGVALLAWSSRRPFVGWLAAAYLVAVVPGNVYVAVAGVDVDGQPGGIYPWVRIPFQALFIAWALWSTRTETPAVPTRAPSRSRCRGRAAARTPQRHDGR